MGCFKIKWFVAGLGGLAFLCMAAFAASVKRIPANEGIESVSVASDLFVDGVKASAITLSYSKKILAETVSTDDYKIEGRVITDVAVKGKDVTLFLDCSNKFETEPEWNSREDLPYETQLMITQTGDISSSNAKTVFAGSYSVFTPRFSNPPIVEKFTERSTIDNSTGLKIRYDIYLPEDYAGGWNYPVVYIIKVKNFMKYYQIFFLNQIIPKN